MSKLAIGFLTLAAYVTTSATVVPMVTSAKADTSSIKHLKKQKKQNGLGDPRFAGQAWPVIKSFGQADVCPGIARGIDCKMWPPPVYEDPDRRGGSADGN